MVNLQTFQSEQKKITKQFSPKKNTIKEWYDIIVNQKLYVFLFTIVNYRRAYINKEREPIEADWRGDHRGAPCRDKQMHLSHRDVRNSSQLAVDG